MPTSAATEDFRRSMLKSDGFDRGREAGSGGQFSDDAYTCQVSAGYSITPCWLTITSDRLSVVDVKLPEQA